MKRSLLLLPVALLAACQDYQFSPVARCLLQPGRASVGTASAVDILFVVDDSFSMNRYQDDLAANFGTFIDRLAKQQQDRVAASKTPFDIYITVTTTSVLANRYNNVGSGTAGECSASRHCDLGNYACVPGDHCAEITTTFYALGQGCEVGVATGNGSPFPSGRFTTLGSNPRMLAFTKDLNWANGSRDATIQRLIEQFKQNVRVGSCGSNQEMPFEAARRAIEMGLAGQQGVPWPHENSKLAVIMVSNEDDCSTTAANLPVGGDPNRLGLVWVSSEDPTVESCRADVAGDPSKSHLIPLESYASFFTGLGRPVAMAFVRPGDINGTNPCASVADARGSGKRTQALATRLRGQPGVSTMEASVCSDFGATLQQIADSLPPPDHIVLPTLPAVRGIVRLRIVDANGTQVRACDSKEWSFVDCTTDAEITDGTSMCVKLPDNSACAPQPGEVLQAEYLGRVPKDGCRQDQDCADALGGKKEEWTCDQSSRSCLCASSKSGG
jgi:hypothetical protein